VKISRTISGPRRNASSYGQEIDRSKKILENILKTKDEQQIEYILSVAKIKARGGDLTVVKLKKLLDKAMLKEEVVLNKMQLVNLYLNSFMPEQAKRFIINIKDTKGGRGIKNATLQQAK